jgi:polyhydroxyalkanoate synthase
MSDNKAENNVEAPETGSGPRSAPRHGEEPGTTAEYPNPRAAWSRMLDLVNGSINAMWQAQQANMAATMRMMELLANSYARLWGSPAVDVLPSDRRFDHDAWTENPAFDLLKQTYLVTSQWMADVVDGLEEVDPRLHHRAEFWSKQFTDAVSPTNFPLTNPAVLQEAVRTGGTNFARGFRSFLSDLQRGRISRVRDDAFEVGVDLAITAGKIVYRSPLMELIQYTPATDQVRAVPILVIPPWINKYYVMDMQPENSMFKYLVDAGFTLFTISWKNPDKAILHLEWDDYMEQGPLEAMRVVKAVTGAGKVNLIGYCLGGIMLEVTLAYLAALGGSAAAKHEEPSAEEAQLPEPNTATYFATHQDFRQAGDVDVFLSGPEVRLLEWLMAAGGGYLDGRNMEATFSMLRSNDLIWRYVIHNYLIGQEPAPFDLLYWNSDTTRVPGRVHSFLVREFFLENKLMQPDALMVKGVGIDVGRIETPSYVVAATRDHIVPWRGTFLMRQLLGGPVRFVLTGAGHIAGIINPPSGKQRGYWTNGDADERSSSGVPRVADPDAWLDSATKKEGSWWLDWIPWLEERSGELVEPPTMGNDEFQPLGAAPGEYVLER